MTKLTEQHIEMETYTVYRHTNPLNNEVFYIGKGTESRKRRSKFWTMRNSSYLEILKSITDANLTPVVDVLNTTTEEDTAYYLEQMWISWYGRKDLNNGTLVNLTDGGAGALNPAHKTRKKMSEYKKGKKLSEETRRKLSIAGKGNTNGLGRVVSDETRLKLGKASSGHVVSEEHKRKLSKTHKGKVLSAETRLKISESHKGKSLSDEHRRKISESLNGRVVSDETKLKKSIAMKAYHANRKLKAS